MAKFVYTISLGYVNGNVEERIIIQDSILEKFNEMEREMYIESFIRDEVFNHVDWGYRGINNDE
jgi:hypothetical protein